MGSSSEVMIRIFNSFSFQNKLTVDFQRASFIESSSHDDKQ